MKSPSEETFECFSYTSYIYMRKHHEEKAKRLADRGRNPKEDYPFPLMSKGER
jgi:hypothetical protein